MREGSADHADVARVAASTKASLANRPIFAPSIQYVTVDEAEGLLTLTGEFGSNPSPKVTVGGTELGIKQSSKSKIVARTCHSPGRDPMATSSWRSMACGATPASSPTGRSCSPTGGTRATTGCDLEGHGQVRFRADVGGYRLKPAETPREPIRGGAVAIGTPRSKSRPPVHSTEQGCTLTRQAGHRRTTRPCGPQALTGSILSSMMRVEAADGRRPRVRRLSSARPLAGDRDDLHASPARTARPGLCDFTLSADRRSTGRPRVATDEPVGRFRPSFVTARGAGE